MAFADKTCSASYHPYGSEGRGADTTASKEATTKIQAATTSKAYTTINTDTSATERAKTFTDTRTASERTVTQRKDATKDDSNDKESISDNGAKGLSRDP